MAVLDVTQFEQLKDEIKSAILAESQGVGDVEVVDSLSGINSLPALKGTSVVEAPLELLSRPAEEAAARADAAASQAVQIANDAVSRAQDDIDAAIGNAEDTASHPTYVGADNYVYVWDKSTKTYNKTSVYVRGEGFKISRTYKSVAEMEADTEHGLKEGDFVLINTDDVENPDNAKIYVVDADGAFVFLVDMSGAIGFTGKTPQIEIGIITIGVGRDDAGAALAENGMDEEGNPKYNLNLHIPSIKLSDLTSEEIAELQSPANDMIAQLEATDESVKAGEEERKEAESMREASEKVRVATEEERKESEAARDEAESARNSAEHTRSLNETARKESETTRNANESLRNANEESRKASENTRVASENARISAENTRNEAESARQEAENIRKTGENARNTQEQSRQASESVREASEDARISNESARQSQEAVRENNETLRLTNEQSRKEAESARTEEYALLKEDILEATRNANDAASESRNTPIIRNGTWWTFSAEADDYVDTGSPATGKSPQIINGTWWTWNDEDSQYIDTGQAVSSDYQLTKEKVEGVFTGDIKTHYHSQYALSEDIPTKISELENDEGYLKEHQSIGHLATKVELAEGLAEKQGIISDLQAIREGAGKGATALQEIPGEYVTESELEQKDYATNAALSQGLGTKQETITDLTAIREGAALGKTSIQESDLTAKGYATEENVNKGLAKKQDLNLYFTNLIASAWVEDNRFGDFGYRCDLACEGVDETMFAQVIFDVAEWSSGQYAPVCETKGDVISIWSSITATVVIPTIIVSK